VLCLHSRGRTIKSQSDENFSNHVSFGRLACYQVRVLLICLFDSLAAVDAILVVGWFAVQHKRSCLVVRGNPHKLRRCFGVRQKNTSNTPPDGNPGRRHVARGEETVGRHPMTVQTTR
jgi:hypothetical protein